MTTPINAFISSTNPKNSNQIINRVNSVSPKSVIQETKADSFEKNKMQIKSKKRNILFASAFVLGAGVLAFLGRKNISKIFSKAPKAPKEKIVQSVAAFNLEGFDEKTIRQMNYAYNDLTKYADNKALNCGVGFVCADDSKRQKALFAFIDELQKAGYDIEYAPKAQEAAPNDIRKFVAKFMDNAKEKFQSTGKRSALVVRDLDIIGNEKDAKYLYTIGMLQELEGCKENGFAWIWDAKTRETISQPLLKRSPNRIIM